MGAVGVRTDELRNIGREAHLQITEFVYDRKNPAGIGEELKHFMRDFAHVLVDISGIQHCMDETGAAYPVCPKPLGALMHYAVGKTVGAFLRTVPMTPYISQAYSSGTGGQWRLDCDRFSERLAVIANAERREDHESPHDSRRMKRRSIP
jgi:hypothetical protein